MNQRKAIIVEDGNENDLYAEELSTELNSSDIDILQGNGWLNDKVSHTLFKLLANRKVMQSFQFLFLDHAELPQSS